MRPGQIQSNMGLVKQAKEKVGEERFEELLEARKYDDWPKRYNTDTDDYYRQKVATHVDLVAVEIAREVLGHE